MEIKISLQKSISDIGEKLVRVTVISAGELTTDIFCMQYGFVLRKIEEDESLEVNQDKYFNSTVVAVEGDENIEKIVERIANLYRALQKPEWKGQEDKIVTI